VAHVVRIESRNINCCTINRSCVLLVILIRVHLYGIDLAFTLHVKLHVRRSNARRHLNCGGDSVLPQRWSFQQSSSCFHLLNPNKTTLLPVLPNPPSIPSQHAPQVLLSQKASMIDFSFSDDAELQKLSAQVVSHPIAYTGTAAFMRRRRIRAHLTDLLADTRNTGIRSRGV
jgi:hypothetical protein